jgi:glycosyltransferase involved in cell wall biosynthesis
MKLLLDGYPDKLLVSIIIPCYNAERWLSHAILSCLEQTYRPIEIVVIDDGSTDGSLDIIKSYDKVITWETGPNRGGNAARNRGFALSKGEYIQFLDADDYLLPEKIARQVAFLEETGADVVYGDWRHQFYKPDGTWFLGKVVVTGMKHDILAALLSPWWVAPLALLWRRQAVRQAGGWDEDLRAGQDKDILLSAALAGATICYQPGCYSIYRRYGNVTVSTSNRQRWLDNHTRILEKAEQKLVTMNRLSPIYRQALAHAYFSIAVNACTVDPPRYAGLLAKVQSLCPEFNLNISRTYNLLQSLFGFALTERLACARRRFGKWMKRFMVVVRTRRIALPGSR